MGIDATSGQKRRFKRFPVDLKATVEMDGEVIGECPIRDLSLGGVAIELEGGPSSDGMEVKIAVENMTPIVGNLVRSEEPIACIKFAEPDIKAAAELKQTIDANVVNLGENAPQGIDAAA